MTIRKLKYYRKPNCATEPLDCLAGWLTGVRWLLWPRHSLFECYCAPQNRTTRIRFVCHGYATNWKPIVIRDTHWAVTSPTRVLVPIPVSRYWPSSSVRSEWICSFQCSHILNTEHGHVQRVWNFFPEIHCTFGCLFAHRPPSPPRRDNKHRKRGREKRTERHSFPVRHYQ